MKPLLIDHYQSLGLENFIESRKRTLPSCQEMSLPVPLGGPQPLPLAAHVPPGGPTAPPPSPFLLSLKVDSPLHPNSSSFLPYLSLLPLNLSLLNPPFLLVGKITLIAPMFRQG